MNYFIDDSLSKTQLSRKTRRVIGRKPVLELLRCSSHKVEALFIKKGSNFPQELSKYIGNFLSSGRTCKELSESEFSVKFPKSARGIAALCRVEEELNLKELVSRSINRQGVLLALDQVKDPHNLGAVLRAAGGFNVDGVIRTQRHSAGLSDAVVRVSTGASEHIPLLSVANLSRALIELKSQGFWILGTSEDGGSSIYETQIPHPLCLVLGSEGRGLRKLTRERCDLIISIPMVGVIESLNVSQAGAICLYEIFRQRLTEDL